VDFAGVTNRIQRCDERADPLSTEDRFLKIEPVQKRAKLCDIRFNVIGAVLGIFGVAKAHQV